jgi:DNA-binding MarR family transcriptional regulator
MTGTPNALAASRPPGADQGLRTSYLDALGLVEKLHRRLLDVIKDALDRKKREDITPIQALLLFNIGDRDLTASELRTRGYYLGSNVAYNIKKLVDEGYLIHQRSRSDRRSVRIRLSPKGQEIHQIVAALYDKHVQTLDTLGGVAARDFETMNTALSRLERFWGDQIRFQL